MKNRKDMKDVVVSTRIRLARNIRNLPFPHKLSGEEEIYSVLYDGVKKACDELFKSKFYAMDKLDEMTGQTLVEKHLISPDLLDSKYGAVIVSDTEDISVMLNEEDHIREQCFVQGYGLQQAYDNIKKVDRKLAQKLDIAHDEKYGYLNTCPTNMGAGMRASVMLFLPCLTMTGGVWTFISKYKELGFTTRGVYGEGSEAEGFMYQISNQAAIGSSEQEILNKMDILVTKLVEAERIARSNLVKNKGMDFKDEIMRAYGVLKYACKISSKEFMEKLALVKLGVIEGYITADFDRLNQLIVLSQPAMLCSLAGKKLNAEGRDVTRSALIKKILE